MFNQQSIRSTLQVDHNELQAFHHERPTMRISSAELSELLFQDVMAAVGGDDIDEAIESGAEIDLDTLPLDIEVEVVQ